MKCNLNSVILILMMLILILPMRVFAGSLEPSSSPGSTMTSLDEIQHQSEYIEERISSALECAMAPVLKTGQRTEYLPGDDGSYTKGANWPSRRFFDNGDGTVTDNLTGLIWLKNANSFGRITWEQALIKCNELKDSGNNSLNDGSSAGDWRLPNIVELKSLRDMSFTSPSISDDYEEGQWTSNDSRSSFTNVQSQPYWSGTDYAPDTDSVWAVNMAEGYQTTVFMDFIGGAYVWPVRGSSISQ